MTADFALRCLATWGLVASAGHAAHGQPASTPVVEESTEAPLPAPQQAAPWLRPWLEAPVPDPNPILADGYGVSVQASAGALISPHSSIPPMLSATADVAWFVRSSKRQALSVDAVGKANLVFDRVTPQFGSVGIGLRRIGRRSGTGFGSVDFERISSGIAFMSRGSNLDLGLSAELSLGVLRFAGNGIGVSLDAYFFEPTNMTGPETLFVIGLGYVHSPVTGMRPSVPTIITRPRPRPTAPTTSCPHLVAYRIAIQRERQNAVQVCNGADPTACEAARERVLSLSTQLTACEYGESVAPPPEVHDAPPP